MATSQASATTRAAAWPGVAGRASPPPPDRAANPDQQRQHEDDQDEEPTVLRRRQQTIGGMGSVRTAVPRLAQAIAPPPPAGRCSTCTAGRDCWRCRRRSPRPERRCARRRALGRDPQHPRPHVRTWARAGGRRNGDRAHPPAAPAGHSCRGALEDRCHPRRTRDASTSAAGYRGRRSATGYG